MTTCRRCGADWAAGRHTAGCRQCGGGALTIECQICGGRCGAVWKRAVMDSQDFDRAHWGGSCALPADEQRRAMAERLAQLHASSADAPAGAPVPAPDEAPPPEAPRLAESADGLQVLLSSFGLLLFGIPVCAAIVSAIPILLAGSLVTQGRRLDGGDLFGMAVFGGGAALVLWIALRAWRRLRAGGARPGDVLPLLARGVPLLIALGALGGVAFGVSVVRDGARLEEERVRGLCSDVLTRREGQGGWLPEPPPAALAACVPVARACEAEAAAQAPPPASGAHVRLDFDYRPEVLCLRKAGRAAGWLPTAR